MARKKDIERALDLYANDLMSYPNSVGIGIGTKRVGGHDTGELCLKVYVKKKKPREKLRPDQLIPASVILPTEEMKEGKRPVEIKIDVEEIGEIKVGG